MSVTITGMDTLARVDQALSEKQVQALLAKTEKVAKDGAIEKYKTSIHFDGTTKHPEWLG